MIVKHRLEPNCGNKLLRLIEFPLSCAREGTSSFSRRATMLQYLADVLAARTRQGDSFTSEATHPELSRKCDP
jgi:hypothetical protein